MSERRMGSWAVIAVIAATFFLLGMSMRGGWVATAEQADASLGWYVAPGVAAATGIALSVLYLALLVGAVILFRLQRRSAGPDRGWLIPIALGLLGAIGMPWLPVPAAVAILVAVLFGMDAGSRLVNRSL